MVFGVSVVNALSKKLIIRVYQNGNIYEQEYAQGAPKTKLEIVGKSDRTGTEITFYLMIQFLKLSILITT